MSKTDSIDLDPVIPPPAPTLDRSFSSHALDESYDIHSSASSDSIFALPPYTDIDGQTALHKSDFEVVHNIRHTLWTIIRGRAMPIKPLLISVFWAIAATLISWATRLGFEPHERGECRWWCTPLAVDGDSLSYVGFALFLLTSFRASDMEGARVWTSIQGTISSIAKYVVQAFEQGCFHRGDRERILGFLVAFPVALKRELRNEKDLRELRGVLAEEDLSRLQNAQSMSSYCLYVLSGYCLEAKQKERQLPQTFIVHLIKWIADLASNADTCNQIKSMPAPYSYITHLDTFLGLWLFFLPFALVETSGWSTIVIVTFISYGILGVVANAAELENPFGSDYNDLPLGRISKSIQVTVADIYHSAKRGEKEKVVREVRDADLKCGPGYWLKKEKAS